MIKKHVFAVCLSFLIAHPLWAYKHFGETLCRDPNYFCMKIKYGERWANLFPDVEERDLVKRINRMNVKLRPGMIIAVPKNIDRITIYDISPFPRYIKATGERTIFVSQNRLAWGAYDEDGELIWWGPISSGVGKCRSRGGCFTPTGSFRVIRKQDFDCVSTVFPVRADGESGGAWMPYCMHFFRGFALHGSEDVPGYRASHGCVRMFIEDARWLNEEFITIPEEGFIGTRVIINAVDDRTY